MTSHSSSNRKKFQVFLFTFCIILAGIHINFKVMFPIYGIRLTIFRSIVEHLSQRGVFNNVKVNSYSVASRIIYELRTSTGAIRCLRLEVVNIEIMQHVFVDKYFGCNRNSIGIRYCTKRKFPERNICIFHLL